MTRVVITVDGAGPNIGSATICPIAGRIFMAQFVVGLGTISDPGPSTIQVAVTPSFVAPIANTGLNPPEIALCGNQAGATAGGVVANEAMLVPCDFPVTPGVQIFVNSNGTNSFNGYIVLMIQ